MFACPSSAVPPKTQPPDNLSFATREVWRIRLLNTEDGPIEVSCDGGATWLLIGRVSTPATASLTGYLASGYAPIGAVAATAVHGIRIRLGGTSEAYPNLINILPREFAATPHFFGGQVSGASGVYTNIPTGVGLFRELAPYVGSPTYLVGADGHTLTPLSPSYVPRQGDTLEIISREAADPLVSAEFVNHGGGAVTATYASGKTQLVTHVVQPVAGVGRFDGTSYTGVGAVNTNHTCVITVSTAPISRSTLLEGTGAERRGGFQIEPYYHNTQTQEVGAPQAMVIGTPHSQLPELEGRPPLFFGCIGLASSASVNDAHAWSVEIRTRSGGARWQPMPALIGNQPKAFTTLGVTAFRLSRAAGDEDEPWLKTMLLRASSTYEAQRLAAARSGEIALVSGDYAAPPGIDTEVSRLKPAVVEFSVDGRYIGVTNQSPWTLDWDTLRVDDGEHLIEADVKDASGRILAINRKLVYVLNHPARLTSITR